MKEEFEVRVMRQMNSDAIGLLKEAMNQHPELAAAAQTYLSQVSNHHFQLLFFNFTPRALRS